MVNNHHSAILTVTIAVAVAVCATVAVTVAVTALVAVRIWLVVRIMPAVPCWALSHACMPRPPVAHGKRTSVEIPSSRYHVRRQQQSLRSDGRVALPVRSATRRDFQTACNTTTPNVRHPTRHPPYTQTRTSAKDRHLATPSSPASDLLRSSRIRGRTPPSPRVDFSARRPHAHDTGTPPAIRALPLHTRRDLAQRRSGCRQPNTPPFSQVVCLTLNSK